jgi:outer membrane protein assembly factor BamB
MFNRIDGTIARISMQADFRRFSLNRLFLIAGVVSMVAAPRAYADGMVSVKHHAAPRELAAGARTEDWSAFLGPAHNGVSRETHLRKTFGEGEPRLLWSVARGASYAAPAVAGDRLFHFHREGEHDLLDCHHRETGAHIWRQRISTGYTDRFNFGDGPRASPVVDGERVYVFNPEGKLQCLATADGKVLWSQDTAEKFDARPDFFGVGSTPLVLDDRLIVQVGAPVRPSLVALNKLTGELLWQAGQDWRAGYASPIPANMRGEMRVFALLGGDSDPPVGGLLVVDPAGGRVTFEFPFRSRRYESVNASSPVIADDRVFISSSYGTGGVALQAVAGGGFEVAWKTRDLGCHFATPIVREGYLYGIDGSRRNNTQIACLDWKTGKTIWTHQPEWPDDIAGNGGGARVRGAGRQTFTPGLGSMIWADGAFLILGEYGHLVWADLSPKGYRELDRTRLFAADETWTNPVISHGLLYVVQNKPDRRTQERPRLLCYDLRGE